MNDHCTVKIHEFENDIPCLIYHIEGDCRLGKAFYYNSFLENITGYRAKEVMGNPDFWSSIIHPEDRERVLAINSFAKQHHATFRADYRILKKSSDVCWIMDEAKPNEDGNLVGYAVDITLKKRMDESMRYDATMYQSMIEDQTECVCRFFGNSRISFVNKAFEKLFGIPRQQLIDSYFVQLIHEECRDSFWRLISEMSPHNTKSEIELLMGTKSSGHIWIEWTVRALLNNNSKIEEFQLVGRDIHDHKIAELDRKFVLEQMSAIYDANPYCMGVMKKMPDGKVIFVSANHATANFFGKPAKEFVGKSLEEVGMIFENIHDIIRPSLRDNELLRGKDNLGVLIPKVFWALILGKKYYFSSTVTIFKNKVTGDEYICFVWHDISKTVELETMIKTTGKELPDGETWITEND